MSFIFFMLVLVLSKFCRKFSAYFLLISIFSNVCTLYLSLVFFDAIFHFTDSHNCTLHKVGSGRYLDRLLCTISASECSYHAFCLLICGLFDFASYLFSYDNRIYPPIIYYRYLIIYIFIFTISIHTFKELVQKFFLIGMQNP